MYRTAAVPDPSALPPPELIVTLTDRNPRSSAVLMFQLFAVPGAIAVATAFVPPLAYVGLAAGAAYGAWQWRRRSRARSVVLRVSSRELTAHEGRRGLARIRLDDLEDVSLDVKTIRRVVEGPGAVPGARFIDSKMSLDIDVARIALVGGGHTVLLNEEYIAHMTATEQLGKIRAFLRKHGWLPFDERQAE